LTDTDIETLNWLRENHPDLIGPGEKMLTDLAAATNAKGFAGSHTSDVASFAAPATSSSISTVSTPSTTTKAFMSSSSASSASSVSPTLASTSVSSPAGPSRGSSSAIKTFTSSTDDSKGEIATPYGDDDSEDDSGDGVSGDDQPNVTTFDADLYVSSSSDLDSAANMTARTTGGGEDEDSNVVSDGESISSVSSAFDEALEFFRKSRQQLLLQTDRFKIDNKALAEETEVTGGQSEGKYSSHIAGFNPADPDNFSNFLQQSANSAATSEQNLPSNSSEDSNPLPGVYSPQELDKLISQKFAAVFKSQETAVSGQDQGYSTPDEAIQRAKAHQSPGLSSDLQTSDLGSPLSSSLSSLGALSSPKTPGSKTSSTFTSPQSSSSPAPRRYVTSSSSSSSAFASPSGDSSAYSSPRERQAVRRDNLSTRDKIRTKKNYSKLPEVKQLTQLQRQKALAKQRLERAKAYDLERRLKGQR